MQTHGKKPAKYYVYFLIDPRNNSIFYIGKGQGKRAFQHAKDVMKGRFLNPVKSALIYKIHQAGYFVEEKIVANDLTEEDAFRMERSLIEKYKNSGLTNISPGIVTNREKSIAWAKTLLLRLKPFEVWKECAGAKRAEKMFGNSLEFYNRWKNEVEKIASGNYVTNPVIG